jgi:PhnB protein
MAVNLCINLTFDGRCEAAFRFYERCLGGKIVFMLTWGDSPMAKDAPPEWGGKILYARLTLGDTALLGADVPPQRYEPPRGFGVMLSVDDSGGAERLFRALSENGTVNTPLQETFWALRYGGVTDQFGIPWEINCEKSE